MLVWARLGFNRALPRGCVAPVSTHPTSPLAGLEGRDGPCTKAEAKVLAQSLNALISLFV